MSERFDAVVLGMGPGGEVAAWRLLEGGLKVAVVEEELIGGECGYWACIPTKTLLRPPEVAAEAERVAGMSKPELNWEQVAAYRDYMIRHLDDSKQVAGYEEKGAAVFKARGRIAGPGRVEVEGKTLQADHIIVATGSAAARPPISGLDDVDVWTNREATILNVIPKRAVVLGGGPVGIELAQMLARFGSEVVVVEMLDRLLAREDPQVGELITSTLKEDGVQIRTGRKVSAVRKAARDTVVELDDGSEMSADVLILAAGRTPRVEDIGLETLGVQANKKGLDIDDRCRVAEGVWAIGDVTEVMLFTHVAKYQARVATANILGQQARADYRAIPRVVFTDPEVAAVGLTEQQAREEGINATSVVTNLPQAIARPWTYEERPRGDLGLVADRDREVLVGAWAVAPLAGEWIHQAALAIRAEIPIGTLLDAVAQFPTFTEGYLSGLEKLDL